jgi:hypothetical protein
VWGGVLLVLLCCCVGVVVGVCGLEFGGIGWGVVFGGCILCGGGLGGWVVEMVGWGVLCLGGG